MGKMQRKAEREQVRIGLSVLAIGFLEGGKLPVHSTEISEQEIGKLKLG